MVEDPGTPKGAQGMEAADSSPPAGDVPTKRLGWVWTLLLLLILPAVGLGLFYGGTRHRVADHPKKVKRTPRRLVPMAPPPRARPAARPVATPAARPAATPATTPATRPVATPAATPAARPVVPQGAKP